jgi:hypothetical protein
VSGRLAELLAWRYGIARLGAALCAAVAAVAVLVELPRALDRLGDRADASSKFTDEDREMGAGLGVVADQRALREARALIPADGSYDIVTGPAPIRGSTELTRGFIEAFAASFLLPRRHSNSAHWVLCYGCDPDSTGKDVRVVWTNGAGVSLLWRQV